LILAATVVLAVRVSVATGFVVAGSVVAGAVRPIVP